MSLHHVSFARTTEAQVAIGRKDAVLRDDQRGLFAVSSGPPAPGAGDCASRIFLSSLAEHATVLSQNVASLSTPTGSWRRVKAVFLAHFPVPENGGVPASPLASSARSMVFLKNTMGVDTSSKTT